MLWPLPSLQRHLPLRGAPLASFKLLSTVRSTPLRRTLITAAAGRMGSSRAGDERSGNPGSDDPKVARIQSLLAEGSKGGWEKCWEEGLTPWDIGGPTPVVLHLLQTGALPKGRVLVPGCGSGHDVVAMACYERHVVGLDISESAIKRAHEWTSTLPNRDCFTFLAEDFFTWRPAELFDLIFDYTFFCAIDPSMRSAWANQIHDLLKPDGELITLMFPIGDHAGGPPYAVSVEDYKEVLNHAGFEAISIVDNELAIEPRKVFLVYMRQGETWEVEAEINALAHVNGSSSSGRRTWHLWLDSSINFLYIRRWFYLFLSNSKKLFKYVKIT